MILSMTGFGRSEGFFEGKKISIDLKSLNSKTFDLNVKMPHRYKEKEFEVRKMLNDSVMRGKIDCYIHIENTENKNNVILNDDQIFNYIQQLKKISPESADIEFLKIAMKLPDAVTSKTDDLNEEEWTEVSRLLQETLAKFKDFRTVEGNLLHEELEKNILSIENSLENVLPYEHIRLDAVKERYRTTLQEFEKLDETRFYQEMAYYAEKLDIAEEKVRLAQHLKYYKEVMKNETLNGKKLGFIAQEIGREINTLGSKANHAEIQKLVVIMKDDLEKIKEQTLNVL